MKTRPKTTIPASALRLLALALTSTAFFGAVPAAYSTNYYWDTNGTTAGSGAATGTWGTDTFWSTDGPNGVLAPSVITTTTNDVVRFSAGSTGTAGTVTVSGTQNASAMTLTQAELTLDGGTIALAATAGNVINVNSTATIKSALTVNLLSTQSTATIQFGAINQTLTLSGGLSNTNNATSGVVVAGSGAAIAAASTLQLNSGAYQISTFNIGDATAGTGGAFLNTGASVTLGNTIGVGSASDGLLTINGGTLSNSITANTSIAVGRTTGTGRMIVSSGTVSIGGTGALLIGFQSTTGNGRVDINGGTVSIVGDLAVGASVAAGSSGTATLNITGGTTSAGKLNFGRSASVAGSGVFTMTGGTLYIGSGGIVQDGTTNYTSTRAVSGGIIGATANWASSLDMTLATTNGSVTFKAANAADAAFSITLSGALSGSGGLIKTGAGSLFLTGAKTFTGDVHLNAGTLSSNSAFVGDSASLYLLTGSVLNLAFSGSDSISKLFIDGVQQDAGTYSAGNLSAFITGSGSLNVLSSAIPEPSTYAALLGLAGLGYVVGRRRR